MNLEKDQFYHLYNRSNRGLKAYFDESNYNFFLQKVENEWLSYFDILAYCLMPTHFHFLIHTKPDILLPKANYSVGKLLSSYTRSINFTQDTHGSIFQRQTKAKKLIETNDLTNSEFQSKKYIGTCFDYIHSNPIKDQLVNDISKWKYSSYQIYAELQPNKFCNMEMAENIFNFKVGDNFIERYSKLDFI